MNTSQSICCVRAKLFITLDASNSIVELEKIGYCNINTVTTTTLPTAKNIIS